MQNSGTRAYLEPTFRLVFFKAALARACARSVLFSPTRRAEEKRASARMGWGWGQREWVKRQQLVKRKKKEGVLVRVRRVQSPSTLCTRITHHHAGLPALAASRQFGYLFRPVAAKEMPRLLGCFLVPSIWIKLSTFWYVAADGVPVCDVKTATTFRASRIECRGGGGVIAAWALFLQTTYCWPRL